MGNKSYSFSPLVLLVLLCFQSVLLTVKADKLKIYIVRLEEGERKHEDPEEEELVMESHLQILTSVLGSKEDAISSIIYSYGFSGFAAKLSRSQAQKIAELPEVICVSPNRMFKPLTTLSLDFLGADNSDPFGLLRRANHSEDKLKIYIVSLKEGERKHEYPEEEELVMESHLQILTSVLGSKEDAISSIIYSYGFSGFAAKLSWSQVRKIAELPEVICVCPNRMSKPLTTRSWDFLGVYNSDPFGLLRRANHSEDIIIGVIDSGVWPEAKSFSNEVYGPVPARWKGKCVPGEHFDGHKCNRKLIGASYYKGGDSGFHGTHIASIAADNNMSNADMYQMPGLPISAAMFNTLLYSMI